MTWEELSLKQMREWMEFDATKRWKMCLLQDEEQEIYKLFSDWKPLIPKCIKSHFARLYKEWREEWGTDGWRIKNLNHMHQLDVYMFERGFIQQERKFPPNGNDKN